MRHVWFLNSEPKKWIPDSSLVIGFHQVTCLQAKLLINLSLSLSVCFSLTSRAHRTESSLMISSLCSVPHCRSVALSKHTRTLPILSIQTLVCPGGVIQCVKCWLLQLWCVLGLMIPGYSSYLLVDQRLYPHALNSALSALWFYVYLVWTESRDLVPHDHAHLKWWLLIRLEDPINDEHKV